MRAHEVHCFSNALDCPPGDIEVFDLLSGRPDQAVLDRADVVLLGGSGDYSVVEGGLWLDEALATMRGLYEASKPTFASCWGFQAMARAMGGRVLTDLGRAEVGTYELELTAEGRSDPVFGSLPLRFPAQNGHMDIVDELPPNAVRLCSSPRTLNHAYRFEGKPIYCTQFHPELTASGLLDRLRAYPDYVRLTTGQSYEAFAKTVRPTPEAMALLPRFLEEVVLNPGR